MTTTPPGVLADLNSCIHQCNELADHNLIADELKKIRTRVAALVEACEPFDIETLPSMHDDQLVTPSGSLPASAYRKLSEALKAVKG